MTTTRFLCLSQRAYRALLILYPEDLRRDFGPEMLEAFANDLSDGYAACGFKGAVRVWRITLGEVIRIAFPAWLQNPAVAVSALSSAAAIVSQSPLLIMTVRRRPGAPTPLDALVAVAIGASITALTSFVAVHRWKRANLVTLDLHGIG